MVERLFEERAHSVFLCLLEGPQGGPVPITLSLGVTECIVLFCFVLFLKSSLEKFVLKGSRERMKRLHNRFQLNMQIFLKAQN